MRHKTVSLYILIVAVAFIGYLGLHLRSSRNSLTPPKELPKIQGSLLDASAVPQGVQQAPEGTAQEPGSRKGIQRPPPSSTLIQGTKSFEPGRREGQGVGSFIQLPSGSKYLRVPFYMLAGFKYESSEPNQASEEKPHKIPATVRALSGKKVAIDGFMMPVEMEGEGVKTFVLIGNQLACCFGVAPKVNEWIYVEFTGQRRAEYARDTPLTVYGSLEVTEEAGLYIESLYRLKADDVILESGPSILRG